MATSKLSGDLGSRVTFDEYLELNHARQCTARLFDVPVRALRRLLCGSSLF